MDDEGSEKSNGEEKGSGPYLAISQPAEMKGSYRYRWWVGKIRDGLCLSVNKLTCHGSNEHCLMWGAHCYAGMINVPKGWRVRTYRSVGWGDYSCGTGRLPFPDPWAKKRGWDPYRETTYGPGLHNIWKPHDRVCAFKAYRESEDKTYYGPSHLKPITAKPPTGSSHPVMLQKLGSNAYLDWTWKQHYPYYTLKEAIYFTKQKTGNLNQQWYLDFDSGRQSFKIRSKQNEQACLARLDCEDWPACPSFKKRPHGISWGRGHKWKPGPRECPKKDSTCKKKVHVDSYSMLWENLFMVNCDENPRGFPAVINFKVQYQNHRNGNFVLLANEACGNLWHREHKYVIGTKILMQQNCDDMYIVPVPTPRPRPRPSPRLTPRPKPMPRPRPTPRQTPQPQPTPWAPVKYYRFINKKLWWWKGKHYFKKCLDLDVKNNDVIVWDCHNQKNQQWFWKGSQLRSRKKKELCITLGSDGQSVRASPCSSSPKAAIKKDGVRMEFEHFKKCLDWEHGSDRNVIAWECNTGSNQQ